MRDDRLEVSRDLVVGLLAAQHPDLSHLELRPTYPGWDNSVWRLGEDLAVRLPRCGSAARLTEKEMKWLPEIAARLPLPVPTMVRPGEPCAAFPLPWYVVQWVDGEPGDRAAIERGDLAADTLVGFLRALHSPSPPEAPVNPARGSDLQQQGEEFEARLDDVAERVDPSLLWAIWDDACSASAWAGPKVWLHGDLHPANVTVRAGSICGVLDFGDLCSGDPAYDLAAAWLLLPDTTQNRFFDTYGVSDDDLVRRARGWAALTALGLLGIAQAGERGLPGGKLTWTRPAEAALHRVAVAL